RCVANLRDGASPPGLARSGRGHGAARARARRSRDARPRRRRLRARRGPLLGRRLPLGRARVRRSERDGRVRALLDPPPSAHPQAAATASPPAHRVRPARRLPRTPRVREETEGAWLGVRAHGRRSGCARARDLVRRQGRRRRPFAAAVLRDGAPAVSRDARAVHNQRARRAGIVLRELSRGTRGFCRPCVLGGLSLLCRHRGGRSSRSGDPGLGGSTDARGGGSRTMNWLALPAAVDARRPAALPAGAAWRLVSPAAVAALLGLSRLLPETGFGRWLRLAAGRLVV